MREYYELSSRKAAEQLKRIDEDRADYVRDAMGKDVTDVMGYDCVINTTHVSYEDAARLIVGRLDLD